MNFLRGCLEVDGAAQPLNRQDCVHRIVSWSQARTKPEGGPSSAEVGALFNASWATSADFLPAASRLGYSDGLRRRLSKPDRTLKGKAAAAGAAGSAGGCHGAAADRDCAEPQVEPAVSGLALSAGASGGGGGSSGLLQPPPAVGTSWVLGSSPAFSCANHKTVIGPLHRPQWRKAASQQQAGCRARVTGYGKHRRSAKGYTVINKRYGCRQAPS